MILFHELDHRETPKQAQLDAIAMPQDVIDRVHKLARRSYTNQGLTFAWRNGEEIPDTIEEMDDDSDDDDEYINDGSNYDDDADHSTQSSSDEDIAADPLDLPVAGVGEIEHNEEHGHNEPANDVAAVSEDEELEEITGVDEDENEDEDEDNQLMIEQEMDAKYGVRGHSFKLCPRRKPNYGYKQEEPAIKPSDYDEAHANLQHIALTQYSIKKGLQVFGEAGADAVVKEMEQLDERNVIEPKRAEMLMGQEKRDALEYLMFLKKKRCGRIKGRGWADGRKQRIYKTKEETSARGITIPIKCHRRPGKT